MTRPGAPMNVSGFCFSVESSTLQNLDGQGRSRWVSVYLKKALLK